LTLAINMMADKADFRRTSARKGARRAARLKTEAA
jgi:hypothetical protein